MEELEQPIETAGSNENFGKFKDAESLLKAYNSLEAEFTKKSQKLASLEGEIQKTNFENTKQAELEKRVDDFVSKFEFIKPFSSAIKESLKVDENATVEQRAIELISKSYKTAEEYSKDGEFLNNYIYSNAEIKDKILKDYLSNITQNSPIKVGSGASSISLTPPTQPTTIQEAGRLAKSIIKNK